MRCQSPFADLFRGLPMGTSLVCLHDEFILWTIAEHGGNVSHAAIALGLHRQTLQRKLKKITTRAIAQSSSATAGAAADML
jgi:DNA-binding NtrC family response regulator